MTTSCTTQEKVSAQWAVVVHPPMAAIKPPGCASRQCQQQRQHLRWDQYFVILVAGATHFKCLIPKLVICSKTLQLCVITSVLLFKKPSCVIFDEYCYFSGVNTKSLPLPRLRSTLFLSSTTSAISGFDQGYFRRLSCSLVVLVKYTGSNPIMLGYSSFSCQNFHAISE
ncbi:hypothetical protein Y032_0030g2164 [Ancylostoma ceylanicum]|uniref:Uncharacterized protein n=1 Tax=Ancylostoma ceylanicum TaxID=53326 RepID=A0A016USZ6_9BILA|nr:hypothetical protein Y032_0030g2164 [Ancylostoma ceylanicum]